LTAEGLRGRHPAGAQAREAVNHQIEPGVK